MVHWWLSLINVIILPFYVIGNVNEAPPVSILIKTPWSSPPIFEELLEYIGSIDQTLYFPFLSRVIKDIPNIDQIDEKTLYSDLSNIMEDPIFIGKDGAHLKKLSMGLRAHAPTVQAYYQYYEEVVVPEVKKRVSSFQEDCPVWFINNNEQVCSVNEIDWNLAVPESDMLPFDHIFSTKKNSPVLIVYADVSSIDFAKSHSVFLDKAKEGKISYVLRYRPRNRKESSQINLSGYGVELALKSSEYSVVDDRDLKYNEDSYQSSSTKLKDLGSLSQYYSKEIAKISEEDLNDLGLQASEVILNSTNPILTLTTLAQNFPVFAEKLTDVKFNRQLEAELKKNHRNAVEMGKNSIWLNGLKIKPSDFNPLSILRILKSEYQLMKAFGDIQLTPMEGVNLLIQSSPAGESDELLFDIRDDIEKNKAIIWLNDLEKDDRYKDYSDSVFTILEPTFPGQLRAIKKNFYNIVVAIDMSNSNAYEALYYLSLYISRGIPIRVGIVPSKLSNAENKVLFNIIQFVKELGKESLLAFLESVSKKLHEKKDQSPKECFEEVIDSAEFSSHFKSKKKDIETIIESTDYEGTIPYINSYLKRIGWTGDEFLYLSMNGRMVEVQEGFQSQLMQGIQKETASLQRMVYFGDITEGEVAGQIFDRPNVQPRRNAYVFPSKKGGRKIIHNLNALKIFKNLDYMTSSDIDVKPSFTYWIVGDFTNLGHLKFALSALQFAELDETINPNIRVSLVHSSQKDDISSFKFLPNLLYGMKNIVPSSKIFRFIKKFLEISLEKKDIGEKKCLDKLVALAKDYSVEGSIVDMIKKYSGDAASYWKKMGRALSQIGIEQGEMHVVMNGAILGPIKNHEEFTDADFEVLHKHEKETVLAKLNTIIKSQTFEKVDLSQLASEEYAETIFKLSVLFRKATYQKEDPFGKEMDMSRDDTYRYLLGDHSSFTVGDSKKALYHFMITLDPLSEEAQKWAPILRILCGYKNTFVKVFLNPMFGYEDLPLKRFYRYVVRSDIHFDNPSSSEQQIAANFDRLPTKSLLTLAIDAHNSWVVTPISSIHDLDNIKLDKPGLTRVDAIFELENILVEGHCFDMDTESPPRGLQLVLGKADNTPAADTIVMSNLGYFQFQANPGVFSLQVREGRSKDLYQISAVERITGSHLTETKLAGKLVPIMTFDGISIYVEVKKNPGKEKESILSESKEDDESKPNGMWEKLTSIFSKPSHGNVTINVFSVASGHLYERFLSVMILSVLKNTNTPVKFWFIKNFLSPSFMNFLPHFAKEFNFDYELVTYKWPSWLRKQTLKQRIIWGYKILFLDVLFPLGLDKVIFVDADQIVRTDLQELVDMDLKGKPYGYTPFCNDRKEIEGFRFWKQGYWNDHLRGKPYHISALYVVDLKRFRELAAGDIIRGHYQMLSADPNSLANLDQDLPNSLQHTVPIHSLPQEWLWCETWCKDEGLLKAKTIDLCNNPMTKEPKLDRAKRLLPEWAIYDEEVRLFTEKLYGGKSPSAEENVKKEKPIKEEL